jgi:hypothetical protein
MLMFIFHPLDDGTLTDADDNRVTLAPAVQGSMIAFTTTAKALGDTVDFPCPEVPRCTEW